MTWLSWTTTILGLLATLAGTSLAYFTFVSPMHRMRIYLKRPSKWEEVFVDFHGMECYWRYKRHPEFILEFGPSDEWGSEVIETWMPSCADDQKSKKIIYAKVNGQTLFVETFIYMDGARYLVPLPRRNFVDKAPQYWYTPLQVRLARILGDFNRYKSMDDFVKGIAIQVRDS